MADIFVKTKHFKIFKVHKSTILSMVDLEQPRPPMCITDIHLFMGLLILISSNLMITSLIFPASSIDLLASFPGFYPPCP